MVQVYEKQYFAFNTSVIGWNLEGKGQKAMTFDENGYPTGYLTFASTEEAKKAVNDHNNSIDQYSGIKIKKFMNF